MEVSLARNLCEPLSDGSDSTHVVNSLYKMIEFFIANKFAGTYV